MCKAMIIAKWFILNTNAEKKLCECEAYGVYEGITNSKLQRLLYYAQGISLALSGKPIFKDPILAQRQGPVVDEVYREFTSYGNAEIGEIELSEQEAQEINALDINTLNILNLTYENFAIYTAWQLRNITTADGTPWDNTIEEGGLNQEISLLGIQLYFELHVVE